MLSPVQESSDRKIRGFWGKGGSLRCPVVTLVSHGVSPQRRRYLVGELEVHHLKDIVSLIWHFLPENKAGLDDP